jgi:hypothetical protein
MLATYLSSTKCTMRHTSWKKRASLSLSEIAGISNRICKNLPGILDGLDLIITEQGLIRCGNHMVPEK